MAAARRRASSRHRLTARQEFGPGMRTFSALAINNSLYKMESIRLGAPFMSASATSGSFYMDEFESRKQTYIGP